MTTHGDRGETFVQMNPLGHRQTIFDAVCQLFPDEMSERVCHYSIRPNPSPEAIERMNVFREDNPTFEADLTVSKAGQTYVVEGRIRNKISGNVDHVRGLIKAVPRKIRPTAEERDKALHSLMSQILASMSRLEAEVRFYNQTTRSMLQPLTPLATGIARQPITIPDFPFPTRINEPLTADSSAQDIP